MKLIHNCHQFRMNRKRSIRKSTSSASISSISGIKSDKYKPRQRKSRRTTDFDYVLSDKNDEEDENEINVSIYENDIEKNFDCDSMNLNPYIPDLNLENEVNINEVENQLCHLSFIEENPDLSNTNSYLSNNESEDSSSNFLLHQYSNVTVTEASFTLNCFKIRFSLSDVCLNYLLKLIYNLLPQDNKLPKNINEINNIITNKNTEIYEKMYCISCSALLSQNKKCSSENCIHLDKTNRNYNSFQYVKIAPQINNLIILYNKEIQQYMKDNNGHYDLVNTEYNKSRHFVKNQLNLILYTESVQLRKNNKNFWPIN